MWGTKPGKKRKKKKNKPGLRKKKDAVGRGVGKKGLDMNRRNKRDRKLSAWLVEKQPAKRQKFCIPHLDKILTENNGVKKKRTIQNSVLETVETKNEKQSQEVPRGAISCSGTQNGGDGSCYRL